MLFSKLTTPRAFYFRSIRVVIVIPDRLVFFKKCFLDSLSWGSLSNNPVPGQCAHAPIAQPNVFLTLISNRNNGCNLRII